MFTKENILKIMQKIQASIPPSYLKDVVRQKKVSPTIKKIISEAVKDESISEAKRKEYQILLDSGELDKVEFVERPNIVKKINAWVDKKIDEHIKAGELPAREELKNYIYERNQNEKTASK